ncbi:uncharacterized protein LOC120347455 isoform X2 [Styela clava]|uniref:uncharacterized protein LOC120347455 isoform X2 n=1 Tax=Styela clava TaxID=7725 RepID=UPI00193A4DCF|nr:uncharacterized protein LOC120347455 isoform X2 [Styela clava]
MVRSVRNICMMVIFDTQYLIVNLLLILSVSNYVFGANRRQVIISQARDICLHFEGRLGLFESPTGEFCCNCVAGSYLSKICQPNHLRKPESRICELCPFDPLDPNNQTYMPTENNNTQCIQSDNEDVCKKYMNTQREMGNRTRNSRCICKTGYHTASGTDDVSGGCHENSPCIEGFEPSHLATKTSDTQCRVCQNGTFSNISSPTEMCIPWSKCDVIEYVKNIGNTTHDMVCQLKLVANNLTNNNVTGTIQKDDITLLNDDNRFYQKKKKSQKSTDSSDKETSPENGRIPPETPKQNGKLLPNHENKDATNEDSSEEDSFVVTMEEETNSSEKISLHEISRSENPKSDNNATPISSSLQESSDVLEATVAAEMVPCQNKEFFNEEQLDGIEKKGFLNCCVERCLKNPSIGHKMLRKIKKFDTEDVIEFLRTLNLGDVAINDAKKENNTQSELRYQCIVKLIKSEGEKLTPRTIFKTETEENNSLRNCLMEEFLMNLKVCHRSSK